MVEKKRREDKIKAEIQRKKVEADKINRITAERKKKVEAFQVMGWVCAKAIHDARLLDLFKLLGQIVFGAHLISCLWHLVAVMVPMAVSRMYTGLHERAAAADTALGVIANSTSHSETSSASYAPEVYAQPPVATSQALPLSTQALPEASLPSPSPMSTQASTTVDLQTRNSSLPNWRNSPRAM